MSYVNPAPVTTPIPIGLERAIEDMRGQLEVNLPWLSFAFGRGFAFNEQERKVPKCYVGSGEYINVLPNDTLFRKTTAASLFFQLRGAETYSIFNYQNGSTKDATIGIIFWGNLKLIDSTRQYIFTEELKNEVEQVLKTNPNVREIVEWVDERAEDVFDKYTLPANTQYLMYPYTGFRVNVVINYPETCGTEPLVDWEGNEPPLETIDDIDFLIGDDGKPVAGQTTYTDSRIVGRKIRLLRGNVKQSKTVNYNGWVYAFNPTSGQISVTPAWYDGELVSIEIIA